jgi:hypothetical protein
MIRRHQPQLILEQPGFAPLLLNPRYDIADREEGGRREPRGSASELFSQTIEPARGPGFADLPRTVRHVPESKALRSGGPGCPPEVSDRRTMEP